MGMTCRQLSMSLHMNTQPQHKRAIKLGIKGMKGMKGMKGIRVMRAMQHRRRSKRMRLMRIRQTACVTRMLTPMAMCAAAAPMP